MSAIRHRRVNNRVSDSYDATLADIPNVAAHYGIARFLQGSDIRLDLSRILAGMLFSKLIRSTMQGNAKASIRGTRVDLDCRTVEYFEECAKALSGAVGEKSV